MSFEMFRDAILTVDLPKDGLCAGDIGTVVERHDVPGLETGYSVEFFDLTGRHLGRQSASGSHSGGPTQRKNPDAFRSLVRRTGTFWSEDGPWADGVGTADRGDGPADRSAGVRTVRIDGGRD